MLSVGGLFDGCGLLAYGLCCAGLKHRWLCEVDPDRRAVLKRRWPGIPVFDDVRTVGAHNAEPVHVIAGGFPCKGASSAGGRAGFGHPETVLWREMARTIGELRPQYVLVENVANLLVVAPPGGEPGELWAEVLGTLATLRYDTIWDCIPAAAFGAPHRRDRVIAIATNAESVGARGEAAQALTVAGGRDARQESQRGGKSLAADARVRGCEELTAEHGAQPAIINADAQRRGVAVEWGEYTAAINRWEALRGPAPEPLVRRMDDGRTARVERSRLSALGDGVQVQLGMLAGAYLLSLDDRQRAAA